jgi:hypothetical protein
MKEDTDKTWMEVHGGFAKDMTLRDEFAGRALQALIPLWHAEHRAGDLGDGTEDWDYFYESFSREAYEMADAMLAAGKVRGTQLTDCEHVWQWVKGTTDMKCMRCGLYPEEAQEKPKGEK